MDKITLFLDVEERKLNKVKSIYKDKLNVLYLKDFLTFYIGISNNLTKEPIDSYLRESLIIFSSLKGN